MFSEYKSQVIRSYYKKREEGSISLNLQHPTPAKLKRECLVVFEIRRTKADLEILREYFGHKEDEASYERAIRRMETDRFRPLSKFLKGEIQNTEDRNIALLSWLIDFSPRPYRPGYQLVDINTTDGKVAASKEHSPVPKKPMRMDMYDDLAMRLEDSISTRGKGIDGISIPRHILNYWDKYKWPALIGFGFLLLVGVLGISSNDSLKNSFGSLVNNHQCMYWSGDHYIDRDCDQKMPNVQLIALDPFKLKHFKRITRLDTITYHDINKIWYAKIDNQIEFYTAEGYDPRQPGRQLRPVSKYIYEKYILKKNAASK